MSDTEKPMHVLNLDTGDQFHVVRRHAVAALLHQEASGRGAVLQVGGTPVAMVRSLGFDRAARPSEKVVLLEVGPIRDDLILDLADEQAKAAALSEEVAVLREAVATQANQIAQLTPVAESAVRLVQGWPVVDRESEDDRLAKAEVNLEALRQAVGEMLGTAEA